MAETTRLPAVLLVDDEEGIRKVVGLTLRDLGYEVVTAADGREGLELFRRLRPELVVTDVRMPRMDGLELLREIKALDPHAEVILATGHGDMDLAVEGLKLDASDFIAKPLDPEVLEVALRRARQKLDMRRRMAEHTRDLEALARAQAARIVEMERAAAAKQAARQAVEGLTDAMCGLAGDVGGLSVFNEMPCFVAIHDRELKIVSVNQLYRQRLGDMVGVPSWEVYGIERRGNCPVVETFRTGKGQRSRETLHAFDGSDVAVVVHTAPLRDLEGNLELVLEIAMDVGEFRRLQEQLATTQDRLASLGMLLASLSHNIKGVLTALDGAAYKVDSGLARNDDTRIRTGWADAKGLMARIKSMVLDILLCAKNRSPTLQEVDAATLARDVAALVEPKADQNGVELRVEAQPGALTLRADPGLLTAALVNLLENAVEACAPLVAGKGERHVTLALRREEDKAVFEVADDGPGMDEETQARLFKVFFSTKGSKGTGLGLYITRQVVESHGGDIRVESAPGRGSRFFLRLPASP